MKRNSRSLVLALMLTPLLMLLAGCKSALQPLPPAPVDAPAIPTLPAQARQPDPPPICSPTCSAGLMKLRTELLDMLTERELPASPVSEATTH